jgi:putative serine protease PepD
MNAQVLAADASKDLALLKVDGTNLKHLDFGDSSSLQVGDDVYAIGNPYGLDHTLTSGIVSALDRQIQAPDGTAIDGAIQTDAALNPGNSGGPLLDADGHVVGVNSQIASSGSGDGGEAGNVGIGFAIPSNTVKAVVEQLKATGKVQHAYLGVQTEDTSGSGATVAALTAGGPAAQGGLQVGDVITSLGGKTIDDAAALSALVDEHKPGDSVEVKVNRNGSTKTLTIKLGQRPNTTANSESVPEQDQQQPEIPNFGGGW